MTNNDFNWLAEHGPELFNKYAGKWIAVHNGEVVGVGDTAPEADEQARKRIPEGDFILEALDISGDTIYAGF
jgi:hypothetical protein